MPKLYILNQQETELVSSFWFRNDELVCPVDVANVIWKYYHVIDSRVLFWRYHFKMNHSLMENTIATIHTINSLQFDVEQYFCMSWSGDIDGTMSKTLTLNIDGTFEMEGSWEPKEQCTIPDTWNEWYADHMDMIKLKGTWKMKNEEFKFDPGLRESYELILNGIGDYDEGGWYETGIKSYTVEWHDDGLTVGHNVYGWKCYPMTKSI